MWKEGAGGVRTAVAVGNGCFAWNGSRGGLQLRERGFKGLCKRGAHIRSGGGRGLARCQDDDERTEAEKKADEFLHECDFGWE